MWDCRVGDGRLLEHVLPHILKPLRPARSMHHYHARLLPTESCGTPLDVPLASHALFSASHHPGNNLKQRMLGPSGLRAGPAAT